MLCLKACCPGLHLSDPPPPSSCLPVGPADLSCPSPWTANPDLPAAQGSNFSVILYILLGSGFQAASVSGKSFQCHISKMSPLLCIFAANAVICALILCFYSCNALTSHRTRSSPCRALIFPACWFDCISATLHWPSLGW